VGTTLAGAAGVSSTDLLELALEAHGRERFERASEIVIRGWAGGLAPRSKRGRVLGEFEARCSTREQRTEFASYPRPGRRGVFEASGVRVESVADGTVLSARADPRAAFPGGRRLLWWDQLDFLYFAGYAIWSYACTPFVFTWPGVESRESEPWDEAGHRWRRLEVTFPEGMHVHSRRQRFYFDEQGLLARIDYDPEVFGKWVRSAHVCGEHRDFDGLRFPTRRRVYPRRRDNRVGRFPTFVRLDISQVELC
jgi:hypothetical protein